MVTAEAQPRVLTGEHFMNGDVACAEGALAAGLDAADVELVDDRDAALALLLAQLRDGDTILVKASRGAALDLLVERLVLAATTGEGTA